MINYRHCRICGSALFFTSAVPFRVVKMRRRSFTPRLCPSRKRGPRIHPTENAFGSDQSSLRLKLSVHSLIFTPRETRAKPSFVRGAFAYGVPAESIFGGVNLIQMRASGRWGVGTEKTSCPKARTRVRPLTREYCSPSFRGPHKIACGDFAGSPIRDKVLSSDIEVLITPFLRVSPEIVPP